MSEAVKRLRTLRVVDVMTREIVEIPSSGSMSQAAQILAQHHLSAAPVVNEQGRCVGILSATDFLRRDCPACNEAAGGPEMEPHRLVASSDNHPHEIVSGADDSVQVYMSGAVQSVAANESLLKAATVMDAQHVHRLPVLDKQGRVVGLISTMDIVAALLNAIDEMDTSLLLHAKE